ncbi:phage head-tail connector protein [Schinkia azotoformans]|uniref:phage head-tail connector protein n=1 Tax=Schinkia azotoformans TaxID=1454 RepID=UPI002DB866F8|nr:phage head-tail connector protein [Schinkia azotoformans]MEC1780072.1 phage head-tail connector protein [Schinkia azotoformans]MED4330849.1 phage head-tail connector protein [Schinkia azotoformans]
MLNSLKLYLGLDLSDTAKDDLLYLLISMAQDTIKGECLITTVPEELNTAVIRIAAKNYNRYKMKSDGLTSQTQGGRSAQFTSELDEDIKRMLIPYKKIRGMNYVL